MRKPILGLMGAAGCGKDTAANHLASLHPLAIRRCSAPLKELCAELFGWDLRRLDNLAYKEEPSGHEPLLDLPHLAIRLLEAQGVSPGHRRILEEVLGGCTPDRTRRQILQAIGTEGFRAIDPDHWVKKAQEAVMGALEAPYNAGVVVTDVRFPNEAAMLQDMGGVVVEVVRVGATEGTKASGHTSENALANFRPDLTIEAENGDLDGLRGQAERAWTLARNAEHLEALVCG